MFDKRWKNRPEGSNWGEFGEDDQIGRMNLLTPQHRLRAVREVSEGIVFPLSLPLDYPGGNVLTEFRKEPRLLYEKRGQSYNFNFQLSNNCACFSDVVCDDAVLLYTQYSTQWDGLGHVGAMFDADGDGVPEKVYYNGYRGGLDLIGPDDSDQPAGAKKLGIENMARAGIQGRGVMLDLEILHGRERVSIDYDALMRSDRFNVTFSEDFTGVTHYFTRAFLTGDPAINRINGEVSGISGSAEAYERKN